MASPALPSNRRLILYFVALAAFLPEALTGSTPPQAWLNPIQALLNFWLYGTGVLLVRELSLRWRTGWPGILVMGAAYGIIEEGLAVTTFFDPYLPQLGTLGVYGRALGVNWVWAVWLCTFHAIFSIAFPIFLMEWRWPALKGRRLLTDRGLLLDGVLLALSAVTINALVSAAYPYRAADVAYLGAIAAILVLFYVAKRWARAAWAAVPVKRPPRSARFYAVLGFAFFGSSFLLYAGGPALGGYPVISVAQGLLVLLIALLHLRRTVGHPEAEWLQFAFVGGSIGFFAAFDAFLVLAGNVLMVFPPVFFVYLVVRLRRERLPRTSPEPALVDG